MVIQRIKEGTKEFRRRVRQRSVGAITAAFAFIIALVWRDAIRNSIDAIVKKVGLSETAYLHEFIVAVILTVVCVLGIMLFSRWETKDEPK